MDEKKVQWERRKQRERELRDKKRGRGAEDEEEVRGTMTTQGTRKKMKIRRLKFETLGEDWGEEDDEERQDPPEPVLPPPPVIRRRGVKHSLTGHYLSLQIISLQSPRGSRWIDVMGGHGQMKRNS